MRSQFASLRLTLCLLLSLGWSAWLGVALPIFTVNGATDTDDGVCDATQCSLREAIGAANVVVDGVRDIGPSAPRNTLRSCRGASRIGANT